MKRRRSFEAQLARLSLVSSVPLLLLLLWVMVYANISIWLILLAALIGTLLVIYTRYRLHQKLVYKFRTLGNLLDGMLQGDYSLRSRSDPEYGELDELISSINGLALRLSEQRWRSVESKLLLHTVIEHIDVAIVALNDANQFSLLNPAAKRLLQLDGADSTERVLKQLAFAQSFSGGRHQVVDLVLGEQQGRFNVHVEEFRESGRQNKLLFITDVRTLLRSEERRAWQSLVRVISHEINNSLSPIASISETLNRLVSRGGSNEQIREKLTGGLAIISERTRRLSQFVDSYRQLTKLPEPTKQTVSLVELLEKSCVLFKNQRIVFESEGDVQLFVDPVQFEQVLINLFKNAVEAMAQSNSKGTITVKWRTAGSFLRVSICDQGDGITNPNNLFVPFYSTKKHGSGVGLVLCRQIVEAHNGRLSLANQTNSRGCCANLEIPIGG